MKLLAFTKGHNVHLSGENEYQVTNGTPGIVAVFTNLLEAICFIRRVEENVTNK